MNIVLAVEQADLRLAIEMMLDEEPGVAVVGVASESEGLLALIMTTQPDLAIIDGDLPGRTVVELLAEIKAREIAPLLIVLAKDRAGQQRILGAGASAFVVKGDPPEKLIIAFREVRSRGGFSNREAEVK